MDAGADFVSGTDRPSNTPSFCTIADGPALTTLHVVLEKLKQEIVKRAAVNLRLKMAHDTTKIQNRKMFEIIHSIPPKHDQQMWFEILESNDIWKHVLSYLTNPVDITNAYLSCALFRKHLENRRLVTLLPNVLKVLRKNNERMYLDSLSKSHLKVRHEFLNLRCVSQRWRNAAEEEILFVCDESCRRLGICHESVCFSTIEHVERAIEALGSSTTCSNLLKAIRIAPCGLSMQATQIYFAKLCVLFKLHGASVRALYFDLRQKEGLRYNNYKHLCELLVTMPSLEYLKINMETEPLETTQAIDRYDLIRFIRENQFPRMPCLRGCAIEMNEEFDMICTEILCKCENLDSVCLIWQAAYGRNGQLVGSNRIPDTVWDALRRFKLQEFMLILTATGCENFGHALRQIRQCDWHLRHIDLVFMSPVMDFIHADDIFGSLGRFSASLETAWIGVYRLIVDGTHVHPPKDFPKLKEIDFEYLRLTS